MGKHRKCVFIGGHKAVDFSNTIKIVNGEKTDLLSSAAVLVEWAEHFRIGVSESSIEKNFYVFIKLRDIIHHFFQDVAYKQQINQEYLKQFNSLMREAKIYPTISGVSLDDCTWQFQSEQMDLTLIQPIIESFLEIVGNKKILKQLKPCENDHCILLFIDTSKSQTRKWCSMSICGNKLKASNFYHRHRYLKNN